MTGLTVEAETDEAGELFGGKTASDLQEDITVEGRQISGSLKFIEGGLAETGPLAGDGYFLALKFTDNDEADSKKVGLEPSTSGMAPVELDEDMNGVFKITDQNEQKFITIVEKDGKTERKAYSLSGLVFQPAGEG